MGDWNLLPCRWHSRAYFKSPSPATGPLSVWLSWTPATTSRLRITFFSRPPLSLLLLGSHQSLGGDLRAIMAPSPPFSPTLLPKSQANFKSISRKKLRMSLCRLLSLLSLKTMYSALHTPFLPLFINFTLLNEGLRPPPCIGDASENHLHTLEGLQCRGGETVRPAKCWKRLSVISITEAFQSRNKQIFVKNGLGRVDLVSEQQTDLQVCSSLLVYASATVIAVVTCSATVKQSQLKALRIIFRAEAA